MKRLPQGEIRSLLEFLRGIYAIVDHDAFVARTISALPRLISCDSCGYNELDSRLGRLRWVTHPATVKFPGSEQVFQRYASEHPLILHRRQTRDARALKFSDFLTRSQLHRLGLYNEFYRRLGVEYHMTVPLHLNPPRSISVAFCRHQRDFSERDRLLLDLLRPHLVEGHGNADVVSGMHQAVRLARRGVEEVDRGIVILTPAGRARLITARARHLLGTYFGVSSRRPNRLPEDLERWVSHQDRLLNDSGNVPPPRQPLVVEREGRRLVARLLSEPPQRFLLLDEQPATLSPASLEPLGLTRREADVLVWVAEGKSNAAVGTILGLSPRTVQKHLEHIYPKLGVETRTAAAARAREVAEGRVPGPGA